MRFFLYLILLLNIVPLSVVAQVADYDELNKRISMYHNLSDSDTSKLTVCSEIVRNHPNVDSVLMWAHRMLSIASIQGNSGCICSSYAHFAWVCYYQNSLDSALHFCYRGLALCDSLDVQGDNKAYLYYLLSGVYSSMLYYRESEAAAKEAISIYTKLNDKAGVSRCYKELASIYHNMMAQDMAEDVLKMSIKIDSASSNFNELVSDYNMLAEFNISRYLQAFNDGDIEWISRAQRYLGNAVALQSDNIMDIVPTYQYIVMALFHETAYYRYSGSQLKTMADSIYSICLKLDSIAGIQDLEDDIFNASLSWACYKSVAGDYSGARLILDSLANILDGDCNIYLQYNLSSVFSRICDMQGDYKNALYWSNVFSKLCMDQFSPADAVELTQNRDQLEFQQERRNMEIAQAKRQTYLKALFLFIALVLISLGWAYYRNRKHNMALNFKNRQITDSINYASLIQQAALPKDELMEELFGQYFVFFRPLNTVAGDFYWASHQGRFDFLVCADCTGHGVPGAFVSMLGVSLLNDVTSNISDSTTAAEILDSLRYKLMKSLNQDKDDYKKGLRTNMDGMDLSMVMIDRSSMKLQYAGAYRPLLIWRDGLVTKYQPDKMPIGIFPGQERKFKNHSIDIRHGDVLYMYSDGIPDQFGYLDDEQKDCKQFGNQRLQDLIAEIGGMEMAMQKSRIESEVDSWKNGYKQLDDCIMVAVRIR